MNKIQNQHSPVHRVKIKTLVHITSLLLLVIALLFFNCNTETEDNSADSTCTQQQSSTNSVSISVNVTTKTRSIASNSIPKHAIGTFPNPKNPNAMTPQCISYTMSTAPTKIAAITESSYTSNLNTNYDNRAVTIGISVEGVSMDPGTAEVLDPTTGQRTQHNRNAKWNFDGLGADRSGDLVGMDTYKGHVQPTGKYHYHGVSATSNLYTTDTSTHSTLVAFAADGFPIFGPYGYNADNTTIAKMYGNYKLKIGKRVHDTNDPAGTTYDGDYDGTFTQDYEYAMGTADVDQLTDGAQTSILDQANGHEGRVPASELEKYNYDASYLGTKDLGAKTDDVNDDTYTVYHYHITDNYPYMPRQLYGTQDSSFLQKP